MIANANENGTGMRNKPRNGEKRPERLVVDKAN